jgi:hypothetical protein
MPDQLNLFGPTERLWTYQEIAVHFNWHPKTVYRHFKRAPRFKVGKNTVRFADSTVKQFIALNSHAQTTETKPAA